jgi:hypothetical protein
MNIISNRFEDLEVWKRSVKLSIDVYKNFKALKDFGFKDQTSQIRQYFLSKFFYIRIKK